MNMTMETPSKTLLSLNIEKRFPEFTLQCESEFPQGVTAIFGPSGSGKTTLLNCIAGLDSPDSGEIHFRGQPYYSSSQRKNVPAEKRRFGYVFQESALFPHMSVKENVLYGYKLSPENLRTVDLDQLLTLLQLGPLMERRVTSLSGGERQRVALARALAASPDLLLLDEPLSSLDGPFRGTIIEHLKNVRRELDMPMVYVSHSISEVIALADTVLVLSKGRKIAQGRPSQVLVHPDVSALADYATLENLIEAEVVEQMSDEGLAKLRIGSATLLAPEVFRPKGERVMVSIRAGDIIMSVDKPPRTSARNIIEATVEEVHVVGPRVLVYADIGTRIIVEITPGSMRDLGLKRGTAAYLIIKTNSIMVLDNPNGLL